jgi:hypothetical protein
VFGPAVHPSSNVAAYTALHITIVLTVRFLFPAEPYVTKALLHKLFGPELAAEAAARYFIEGQGPGGYRFRPEYYSEKVREDTQRYGHRACFRCCCPAVCQDDKCAVQCQQLAAPAWLLFL